MPQFVKTPPVNTSGVSLYTLLSGVPPVGGMARIHSCFDNKNKTHKNKLAEICLVSITESKKD